MNKYVIKEMLKNGGGSIVNTSSMYGLVGTSTSFSYAATKGAINQMTRCLALSYAKKNIRVNAIAPGMIVSDMTDALSDKVKENILTTIPLNRFGKAEEVAQTAVFLAENDYITGQVITVDGGMTI